MGISAKLILEQLVAIRKEQAEIKNMVKRLLEVSNGDELIDDLTEEDLLSIDDIRFPDSENLDPPDKENVVVKKEFIPVSEHPDPVIPKRERPMPSKVLVPGGVPGFHDVAQFGQLSQ